MAEAVRPVVDLAPAQRNRSVVVPADRVSTALLGSPARDAIAARDLCAEIEACGSSRRALPR